MASPNLQVSALSSGPSPVPVPVLPVGGPAVPLPSMPVPMPVLMPRASTEMRPETREHRSSGAPGRENGKLEGAEMVVSCGFNVVCWFEDEHFEVEDSKLNDVCCGEIPNGIPKKWSSQFLVKCGEMCVCVSIYISD